AGSLWRCGVIIATILCYASLSHAEPTRSDPEVDAEPGEPAVDAVAEPESAPEPAIEAESSVEPDPESTTESELGSEPEPTSGSDAESDTDAKSEPAIEAEPAP